MNNSLTQLQLAYRQVFESPNGVLVLKDLERIINQTRVSADAPNPYSCVLQIGQQQLLRRITNMCRQRSTVENNKDTI